MSPRRARGNLRVGVAMGAGRRPVFPVVYTRARATKYGRLVYLRLFDALFDLRHKWVYTTGILYA